MESKIINGDVLEEMKNIPNKSIDLVVTDPPYLMDYQSGRRGSSTKFRKIANDKDSYNLITEYFAELSRVLKDDTAIYVFCSWHKVDFFKTEFEKHFTLKNIVVWNKNNHGSGDLKGAYAPKHEFILFGHKGRTEFRRERIPDVISCAKVSGDQMTHPTEKPTELIDVFIRNSSDPGDMVFDGFLGTGAVGVSAVQNGRFIYGVEIEKDYVEIARRRVENSVVQLEFGF